MESATSALSDSESWAAVLQYQHARTLVVGWIIFDNHGFADSDHEVVNEDIVICEFVISMIRDLNLATSHQITNLLKCLTPSSSGK